MQMQINWDSFKIYNIDSRGIRFKFEDLCRILFANEFLSGNKQFRYLHSNPNNPGLETEPIFSEQSKQWIGFQAKYFENGVDYDQIKRSANQIIDHYTGKDGFVDLVYLFSNKPISSKAKGYKDTVNLLSKHNIDVRLITDDAILDLVRNKYAHLGLYFFGNHTLNAEWFATHISHALDDLGERYNRDFNIETESLKELSLFLRDESAVDYLNNKKKNLLIQLNELALSSVGTRTGEYLPALKREVEQLSNVNIDTLNDVLIWKDTVMPAIAVFHRQLNDELEKLHEASQKQHEIAINADEKERENAYKKYYDINRQISKIDTLIKLPDILAISDRERLLLSADTMTLCGRAGTGKSQLLAYKAKAFIDQNRAALLLPAGFYFSDVTIQEQIMRNLHIDYSFDELINVLETVGERDNCIVPLFIDALNETWNHRLWKVGLPYIIDVVKKAPMVKLVVSYRTEYEPLLLSGTLITAQKNCDIVKTEHFGFEGNSGTAVKEFLNHYNIPFSPLEYFRSEMSNPLFLTLYCKTYNGEEVSLPSLYERLISQTNTLLFRSLKLHEKGFTESDDTLRPLISQMSEQIVLSDRKVITQQQLSSLSFWTEHGLSPIPYVNQLVREGLLHDYNLEGEKVYYFAYDQMNDYYCAKFIIDSHPKKKNVREYIMTNVLNIKQGKLSNYGNIDLFVNICALYAGEFGEECINIIDAIEDKEDQWQIFKQYIYSFLWRDPKYINKELLLELLSKYFCEPDDLWPMLIGNSIKVQHPLNADFLHEFLCKYELNRRDYVWTIYINRLTWEEENRVVQLIQMYDRGEKLDEKCEKQIELLLTLFGWLLTSSNRWLRDYTSKAMIEILKNHFQLCQPILEKFKDVDDPYVVQRLYGIVFGACCKRTAGDYQSLAEYIYENVFNQEKVYPDILLRDYARLIIERYLWETPDYSGIIERKKIIPPYNSDPIPKIEDQHYEDIRFGNEDKCFGNAIQRMVSSMRTANTGWYGDFGRYVFQSALSNFEVDIKQMFNYAVYYILNELGLNEDYFADHDKNCVSYDRNETSKTERIGKKYQWITMYNMLARISDHCKMVDRWYSPEKKEIRYEGAWEPYVRDFDPTLNSSFMVNADAPIFDGLKEHVAKGIQENQATDTSSEELENAWLERNCVFFDDLKRSLILTDENGQQWVGLTKHCDTRQDGMNAEKLLIWSWLYAYFVNPEQSKELSNCFEKGFPIINDDSASHHETYTVFNREYPWSPSCRSFEEYAWTTLQIETDEIEKVQVPDFSIVDVLIHKYCGSSVEDENLCDTEVAKKDEGTEEYQYKEIEQHIEKDIDRVLHATTCLLWEEEYDATKETSISWSVPCGKLIETMKLRQMIADGFYYDSQGALAAFDASLTQDVNCVVVRKDILDGFLMKTGLKLVWLVDAEKEIHDEKNKQLSAWSDWEGVFVYEGNNISGDLHRLRTNTRA